MNGFVETGGLASLLTADVTGAGAPRMNELLETGGLASLLTADVTGGGRR